MKFLRGFFIRGGRGGGGGGEGGFAVTSINMVIVAGVKFSKSKFHDNRNETANNGAKDGA